MLKQALRAKPERGFTLVELILIMVVLGILAAVAAPRFFDRSVFDERLYFEEVLSAVRYAQKVAVASGCEIRVEVDNSGYRLTHAAPCDTRAAKTPVADPAGGAYRAANTNSVSVAPTLEVTFNALGGTDRQHATTVGGTFDLIVHETGFVEATP
ncbi:type II secretion system protein [Pseudomonas sp.]|uniref:pilus assembly FimT family protein n=1 Tax=Pseudomonas sp. TaxID=306 RepID=UPI0019DA1717|nr:type II secretion system protein [Pseudomonas sp.]MBF0674041.1 type II secretion system protein [Pseudomonas sp.]